MVIFLVIFKKNEIKIERYNMFYLNLLFLISTLIFSNTITTEKSAEGNHETKRRLEQAGCAVYTYKGNEISYKAEGGAACLTRPLLRG